jgi:polyphosphate kinase
MGSADWMGRNLDHRVETTIPVLDAHIRTRATAPTCERNRRRANPNATLKTSSCAPRKPRPKAARLARGWRPARGSPSTRSP